MVACDISLDNIGKIVKQHDRGFLTELEMEAMILSAVFNRAISSEDVLDIRVFIQNNL